MPSSFPKLTETKIQASLTLDLVNDCLHFVTGFFEIINESAPHIYHSALPFSPKTSIVWRLYKSYARPLTRIVHGLPTLWEQSITTTKFPSRVNIAAWSPCSRFVAISWGGSEAMVEIWDAIRFGQPTTLELPLGKLGGVQQLVFSPDGCLLTLFGKNPGKFISWDIQTGVLVSAIPSGQRGDIIFCLSITYSTCGTMFGASFRSHEFTIHTYNVFSGTHIHSHSIEGSTLGRVWTHGEFFQAGTVDPGSVTIWEAEFASVQKPKEVMSLHVPDDLDSSKGALFHPTTSRFAICTETSILIWSAQDSKLLLDCTDPVDCDNKMWMSFSADGHFFACGIIVPETTGPEIYLWKESPTGYVLHQKLLPNTGAFKPLISPNGEYIIGFGTTAIQLWHTTDSTTSPPTDSCRVSQRTFILGFSPDGTSAAVTRMGEKVVKVLDLKSGNLQLVIDMGVKVYGLRMGENTIVIVGEGRIVTWNLPGGDCIPNLQVNTNDSVQTTRFNHPRISTITKRPAISVSPNLHHVAIVELGEGEDSSHLHLYDVSTGQRLGSVLTDCGDTPWFTLDGGEIWCVTASNTADRWKIVKESRSGTTKLEHAASVTHPPDGFPWNPSNGYEVMFDRWLLHPSGGRLLWLPSHWQLFEWQRMWDGQYLALLHDGLPDALILELE